MNAPFITALSTMVPDPVPLSRWYGMETALRVSSRSGWDPWVALWRTERGCHSGVPAIMATHDPGTGDDWLPRTDAAPVDDISVDEIPVELDTDLSGLAAVAAQAVCHARDRQTPPVDVVMFCHSSLNEHVSTTTAGRLRAVVGSPCFAFAISQQQGASFFTSLRLATDLLAAEPAVCTILIVAAEKWRPPFSRWAAPWVLHGDAAGAVLVERARPDMHGLRLISARTRALHPFHPVRPVHPSPPFQPSARLALPDANSIWTPAICSLIDGMLSRHGLHPRDLCAVTGHHIDAQLVAEICRHLGLPETVHGTTSLAYLGAAESVVRLAETLDGRELPQPGHMLAWGIGLGGFVSCALLESQGRPPVYRCANLVDRP